MYINLRTSIATRSCTAHLRWGTGVVSLHSGHFASYLVWESTPRKSESLMNKTFILAALFTPYLKLSFSPSGVFFYRFQKNSRLMCQWYNAQITAVVPKVATTASECTCKYINSNWPDKETKCITICSSTYRYFTSVSTTSPSEKDIDWGAQQAATCSHF